MGIFKQLFQSHRGKYDLRIYSDSNTDLDIVAIYPSKSAGSVGTLDRFSGNSPI